MPQILKRRPGDAFLPARDWNSVADAVNGGVSFGPPAFGSFFSPSVLVRNDTGSDRSMFDCISLGDPLYELATDGSVDLIFAGETADEDKPAAILVEPIAHDATEPKFGRALLFGLAYALVGPAAATTILRAKPDAANHRLVPDPTGSTILLGAPSTTTTKLLPVLLGAGSSAGGTYLYTLTADMSGGSGTATIRTIDDATLIGTGKTVVSTLGFFDGLVTGQRGTCVLSGSNYYATGPYVTGVRWDDPNIETSRDGGSSWDNVDVTELC